MGEREGVRGGGGEEEGREEGGRERGEREVGRGGREGGVPYLDPYKRLQTAGLYGLEDEGLDQR